MQALPSGSIAMGEHSQAHSFETATESLDVDPRGPTALLDGLVIPRNHSRSTRGGASMNGTGCATRYYRPLAQAVWLSASTQLNLRFGPEIGLRNQFLPWPRRRTRRL